MPLQLELIPWQEKDIIKEIPDWNRGKYDSHVDYFWEYAVSGCGTDVFHHGNMVTGFFIHPADVSLFPELEHVRQIILWEDSPTETLVKVTYRHDDDKCFFCKDPLMGHREEECDGLL